MEDGKRKVGYTTFRFSKDDVAAVQRIKEIFEGYSVTIGGCYTGSFGCIKRIRCNPFAANDLSAAWSKTKDIIKAQRSMSPQEAPDRRVVQYKRFTQLGEGFASPARRFNGKVYERPPIRRLCVDDHA